uniref:response regulator n=1 Tax=uncultured Bacteroides sp. TaxID=162156 RepID=UPI00280B6F8A
AFGDDILPDIRVLYIDDDRMQLDAVRRMYLHHGIECDCCTDIDEMVTALRRHRYDLVLTDMRMSDTDGYGVLALLRNSNIGQSVTVPVLAVTACVDSDAARFEDAGFAGCLHKPFSEKELMAATRSVERPDFTYIMEGEEHADELLDIFIEDTETGLAGIRDASGSGDYERLGNIIHKAVPVWETIRIDVPLQELAYMGSLPPEKWADISGGRIERLVRAVEETLRKAITLKEKMNGDNTGSGG